MVSFFNSLVKGKLSKSISLLLLFNFIGIIINLLYVPLMISVLDTERYGIWLTITTMISWIGYLDIGLGHGLRNKVSESLAVNDEMKARAYISTAYFSILVIVLFLVLISIFIIPLISWHRVLNAPISMSNELSKLMFWVLIIFSIQFLFRLVNSVLLGAQKPEAAYFVNISGQIIGFLSIFILVKFNINLSLVFLGIIISIAPLLVMIFANLAVFKFKFKNIAPKFSFFNKNLVKPLLGLGYMFFAVQITSLLLFQSNNIIIAHTVGPSGVTEFNIAFKYLGILNTVLYLISTPFWSASSEAFFTKNFSWVSLNLRKLNLVWVVFIFLTALLVVVGPMIYHLWLGEKVKYNFSVLILMGVYYIFYMQWTIYGSFINGSGKLKLQFLFMFVEVLIHIPMAILLGLWIGLEGVIVSMIFIAGINMVWPRIQIKKLLNQTASGIWNK
ncbi:Na+-driven multidrug efflux pump [Aquiflexum balticum DSM 16537]|uniref:Na+-driven multidrug efflux pump n=1 Tax=Aquiflexum balticum DSM 16537 TaxID=758820 RepID=A0A1W2H6N7_9BACT|nr:oligosaccharide flippase family protein [Aquiflexum balticum]SMD44620.1 Na+-driven multidrug efflux pump [Aquiflexum balticum DSM 16537]